MAASNLSLHPQSSWGLKEEPHSSCESSDKSFPPAQPPPSTGLLEKHIYKEEQESEEQERIE